MNSMSSRGVCFREAFVASYNFVAPRHGGDMMVQFIINLCTTARVFSAERGH